MRDRVPGGVSEGLGRRGSMDKRTVCRDMNVRQVRAATRKASRQQIWPRWMEGMGLDIQQESWYKLPEDKRGDVGMHRPGSRRDGGDRLCRTKCSAQYERRSWWMKNTFEVFAQSSESMGNGPLVGADTVQQHQYSRLKGGQLLRTQTSSTRPNFCLSVVTIISCVSPKYLKPKPN